MEEAERTKREKKERNEEDTSHPKDENQVSGKGSKKDTTEISISTVQSNIINKDDRIKMKSQKKNPHQTPNESLSQTYLPNGDT